MAFQDAVKEAKKAHDKAAKLEGRLDGVESVLRLLEANLSAPRRRAVGRKRK